MDYKRSSNLEKHVADDFDFGRNSVEILPDTLPAMLRVVIFP